MFTCSSSTLNFLSTATAYLQAYITNQQITVIYLLATFILASTIHTRCHPGSQFLRLRCLCGDDSDFTSKCEEMCQFFKKCGHPDSAVTTGKYCAQEINRETTLQTSHNEETNRIPFTLTHKTLQ